MSSRLESCLTPGRVPSGWQRQIAQDTAWLNAVTRNCAWLDEITAVRMTLNDTPLLGQSLVTLTTQTGQVSQQNSTGYETPRQARPAPRATPPAKREHTGNGDEVRRPREQETRFPGEAHEKPSTQTKPSAAAARQSLPSDQRATYRLPGPDRRIERVLLRRWAGEAVQEYAGDRPRSRPIVAVGKGRQRNRPGIHRLPMQQQTPFLHDWQDTLVKRTRHVLHNAYQPAAVQTGQEEALLSQPWRAPIRGQTAPQELLLSLASLPGRESTAAVSNERDRSRPRPAPENRAQEKLPTGGVGSTGELMLLQSSHALPSAPDGGSNFNEAPEEHLPLSEQAKRIMPPAVASRLPSLTSSQRVDALPLPVATATVRLGARAEMMIEDDLDMLAAKIKRILDDEARRHGIDV